MSLSYVRRGGRWCTLPVNMLVTGDIISLEVIFDYFGFFLNFFLKNYSCLRKLLVLVMLYIMIC